MHGFGQFHYLVFVLLLMTGLYAVIVKRNYVKKIIGLSIFQSSVFLLYISMGKVDGGTAPVVLPGKEVYSHPLPHVLILTAIVVGISTQALGFAILVRIREAYGTVEADELTELERRDAIAAGELD